MGIVHGAMRGSEFILPQGHCTVMAIQAAVGSIAILYDM